MKTSVEEMIDFLERTSVEEMIDLLERIKFLSVANRQGDVPLFIIRDGRTYSIYTKLI